VRGFPSKSGPVFHFPFARCSFGPSNRALSELLDRARPQRPILATSADAIAARRFRRYVETLTDDTDATLDDVAAPEIARPRSPSTRSPRPGCPR
jgi:hypothetical protein